MRKSLCIRVTVVIPFVAPRQVRRVIALASVRWGCVGRDAREASQGACHTPCTCHGHTHTHTDTHMRAYHSAHVYSWVLKHEQCSKTCLLHSSVRVPKSHEWFATEHSVVRVRHTCARDRGLSLLCVLTRPHVTRQPAQTAHTHTHTHTYTHTYIHMFIFHVQAYDEQIRGACSTLCVWLMYLLTSLCVLPGPSVAAVRVG